MSFVERCFVVRIKRADPYFTRQFEFVEVR